MTLPETVDIAGLTFQVQQEEGEKVLYNNRFYGMTDLAKQVITVRSDMADDMKRSTLVHEMLHVLFLTCGLNLEHDQEEKEVAALESVTFRWLVENDFSWLKA